MKRIISTGFCFVLLFLLISGCSGSGGVGEQPSSYTDEVQSYTEQPLYSIKTTNFETAVNYELTGNQIRLYGAFEDDTHKYLLAVFEGADDAKESIPVIDRRFDKVIDIPDSSSELTVDLYGGPEQYGNFESIVIDFIKITKVNETWQFVQSPVYAENLSLLNAPKDKNDFLGATNRIQSDDPEIVELAVNITDGLTDDYEKVKAVHDWVASNIYYDYDSLASGTYENMDAKNVLISKKGVCEGYANLMSALLRSLNISCRVQGGFALGVGTDKDWGVYDTNTVESNHAWNEVYVNGRWIIVDATWDSQNEYRNGSYLAGEYITDIFFDSTPEFFSLSHLLMETP